MIFVFSQNHQPGQLHLERQRQPAQRRRAQLYLQRRPAADRRQQPFWECQLHPSLRSGQVYNGDGVRVGRTVNDVTTSFVPDVNTPLPAVLESHGAATTRYLYGLDLLAERSGTEWLYYHADALGSTRSLTDGLGDVAGSYVYAPFGSPLVAEGPAVDFRFTGEPAEHGDCVPTGR